MKTVLELEELANQAIKAALAQRWQEAISLNHEFLADEPTSVEALNRLGRAYQEMGNSLEAKKAYQQVLTVDPYNAIAQKNLTKLEQGAPVSSRTAANQAVFLEEPGKTRSTLLQQPNAKRVGQLSSGEELALQERQGRLAVTTTHNDLLGYIDDDLGGHLLNLMHLGNQYSVHLMTTSEEPQVFLREASQSPEAAKFISFTRSHTASHTPGILHTSANDDGFASDSGAPDEESDNWDENQDETELDPDDDFNSVSLEALREEEEGSYSGRDEY